MVVGIALLVAACYLAYFTIPCILFVWFLMFLEAVGFIELAENGAKSACKGCITYADCATRNGLKALDVLGQKLLPLVGSRFFKLICPDFEG